jgi:hypothetical protein
MSLLGENLYKRLCGDFEESFKRIENKTSEELKLVINKVYDNIMSKCYFKKQENLNLNELVENEILKISIEIIF